MTLSTIWDIVHAVLKKESRGNIIKPDEFTTLLQQCHLEYYNQQYEKWAVSQTAYDSLRPFIVSDESLDTTGGYADLSSDLLTTYKHMIGLRDDNTDNPIDLLTPQQWNQWYGDAVMQGTQTYPVGVLSGVWLYIYPTTIDTVRISYLKDADYDPFFDYYIDANDAVQAMGSYGTAYSLQTGETYRDGTASGSVSSIMRELEWGDQDIVNIVSLLSQKLGVAMQAPDITQYAMALQQQQNVA